MKSMKPPFEFLNITDAFRLREYVPELARAAKQRVCLPDSLIVSVLTEATMQEKNLAAKKQESLSRFMKDLSVDPNRDKFEKFDPAAMDEDEEDDYDDDGEYIDRSEPCRSKAILINNVFD